MYLLSGLPGHFLLLASMWNFSLQAPWGRQGSVPSYLVESHLQ